MTTGPDVSAAFAATVVDEWVRAGVTDAVFAPGSRSTPLIMALSADHRLRLHPVLDERSGGFVALGIGLATGRPAVMVTTSGTAAVELHPAVVEAHHAGVPLIAVTADRPPEAHHVGAPQTVEQETLFGASTRWSVSPGVADDAGAGSWRSLASRTVAVATGAGAALSGPRPGPVHLNLAFREPLLGHVVGVPPGRLDGAPWHRMAAPVGSPPAPDVVAALVARRGGRGLVVAGAGAGAGGSVGAAAVTEMCDRLGWPLLADPRSELRVPAPRTVAAADALLRVPSVAALIPDIVVRVGQPWASKVVNQWLDGLPPGVGQILVDPHCSWEDPGRQVAVVERSDPASLGAAVVAQLGPPDPSPGRPSPWLQRWADLEAAAQGAIDTALAADGAPSEPALARRLMASLADGTMLVCSSSMPVRDIEWWGRPRHGIRVMSNRGANGIDGIVSTAIGVALGSGAPTVAVVGDLAFLYDAGALLWARDRPIDLTIVVVDNDGGGIFSFLPQAGAVDAPTFERLWGTPHGLDLAAVVAAYGLDVVRLSTLDDLGPALGGGPGVRAVIANTGREANVAVHRRLHSTVAAAVGSMPGR